MDFICNKLVLTKFLNYNLYTSKLMVKYKNNLLFVKNINYLITLNDNVHNHCVVCYRKETRNFMLLFLFIYYLILQKNWYICNLSPLYKHFFKFNLYIYFLICKNTKRYSEILHLFVVFQKSLDCFIILKNIYFLKLRKINK